ncbi:hypothetical protein PTTG_27311 [Puccinia triticina 1-1 BBBD Race 1]|uniref:Secreted protein n=2 Tax=Puccinia triticina TaxID=208348 RepID=A0A180GNM9_PUCT1|nr:uncharacterized protein PtA15_3A610 [Puccinia triticina]OAV93543.1 hypothetical protein PTTG_27311 [Puccinia triticina 1-1 BBBD Race 1]WAQ83241.1 hypothetical protein PtA15_3A610 [Puccinia triticina]WAR54090.1 hypothetical protein PtB15_3B600 [Puccinia triticina]
MALTWSAVFVLLMAINQTCSAVPSRMSSEVEARDTIYDAQLRCFTKKCADSEANGYQSVRDEPETPKRRPLRQSAPVKCGDTGLPPPCGPQAKKGSRPNKSPWSKGRPKPHQTAPVTCSDTGLPPPCH